MTRWRSLDGFLFVIVVLAGWEAAARAGWLNPLVIPALSRILDTFSTLVLSGEIPLQNVASLKRALLGYLLAAVVFVPVGILMGLFRPIRRALEVIVEMMRPIPPPVMIPVAMLFFGLEDGMKIVVIFFSCAWPILLNTMDGVGNIDPLLVQTARTFRLSRPRIIRQVIFPAALPQIMTGLRVSLPIMLILVVISEMVGSSDGIGYFILDSQRRFRIAQMYAGMAALAILGWALNQLFNGLVRLILPWQGNQRMREEG